jgi:hypothetical protein
VVWIHEAERVRGVRTRDRYVCMLRRGVRLLGVYMCAQGEAPLKTGFSDLSPDPGRSRINKLTVWITYIWMVGALNVSVRFCL